MYYDKVLDDFLLPDNETIDGLAIFADEEVFDHLVALLDDNIGDVDVANDF